MFQVTRYPMISKIESGRVSKEILGSGSSSGTRWALEVSRGTWLTSKLVEEVVDKKSVKRFWVQTFSIQSVYSSFIAKNSFQESCWQGRKSGWFFCQSGPTFATFLVSHTLCQRHLLLWLYHTFFNLRINKKKEEFHQKHYFIGRIKILSTFGWMNVNSCKSTYLLGFSPEMEFFSEKMAGSEFEGILQNKD